MYAYIREIQENLLLLLRIRSDFGGPPARPAPTFAPPRDACPDRREPRSAPRATEATRWRHPPDSTQRSEAPNESFTGLTAAMLRIGVRADCDAPVETSPVGVVVFDAPLSGEYRGR